MVMMTDKIWYPALNVVSHYHSDFKDSEPPKKVDEMMTVAIAMAGLQEVHQKPYWIQGVEDSEKTPDVRTLYCDPVVKGYAPWCYQEDVEVVTYTEYSAHQTLVEFVAGTKLAPTAAYDDLTTVLVNVQSAARLPSADEWSEVLGATGKQNPVMVLGKVRDPYYRLAFVHPTVSGAIDFDPYDLLKRQGYTRVVKWSRGTRANNSYSESEKHCPFEKFGIKCALI